MKVVKVSARTRLSPHFTQRELACRCRRKDCDAAPMRRSFMEKLEALRVDWDAPLIVTSGQRCRYWNALVGGADKSQHLFGNAADLYCPKEDQDHLIALAEKHGFGGIGVASTFIHVDDREGNARWEY